ncbi:hypothetical protein IscW_ISCW001284, partial [Ixodes scapularis]
PPPPPPPPGQRMHHVVQAVCLQRQVTQCVTWCCVYLVFYTASFFSLYVQLETFRIRSHTFRKTSSSSKPHELPKKRKKRG